MAYTSSKIKEFVEALLTKYGYYTADTQEIDKLSLTAAYKLVSGVQDLGQLETVEAMFEHASTDAEKEELFLNLVRMLPHGTKGIDYDIESEPTGEPSEEPSEMPTISPEKIADIDTTEEKEELIAGIEGAKGSTEAEDLAKYDLDNDGDIDDTDKELASSITIESSPTEAVTEPGE